MKRRIEQTQGERGEVEPGTPEGAPVNLDMWKKARLVTWVAAIVWAVVGLVVGLLALLFASTTTHGVQEVLFSGQDALPSLIEGAVKDYGTTLDGFLDDLRTRRAEPDEARGLPGELPRPVALVGDRAVAVVDPDLLDARARGAAQIDRTRVERQPLPGLALAADLDDQLGRRRVDPQVARLALGHLAAAVGGDRLEQQRQPLALHRLPADFRRGHRELFLDANLLRHGLRDGAHRG